MKKTVLDANSKLEKLDTIENKCSFTHSDISLLEGLARDANEEIRLRVAQVLVFAPVNDAERILLEMTNDTNELVRINVCDSLCCGSSQEVLRMLFAKALNDTYLVRSYAVLSIADVTKNGGLDVEHTRKFLEHGMKKERSCHVKISYCYALCVIGYPQYARDIFEQLNHRSYQIRCFSANIIHQLVEVIDSSAARNSLETRLLVEKANSVRIAIQSTLNSL